MTRVVPAFPSPGIPRVRRAGAAKGTPARRRAGAVAQASGARWEDSLARHHLRYEREGHRVIRCGQPFRVRRKLEGDLFAVSFDGVAPPDWIVLLADCRVVVAEAKSTGEDRWPVAALEEHQADVFKTETRKGHICGVLVRTPHGAWWVPWPAIAERWEAQRAGHGRRGECSLTAADLDACGVAIPDYDWLGAAVGGSLAAGAA